MAIISGFKPADVKEVKPLELPIDDMAKGLLARQDRADKARNAFTTGNAALAIDTRPLQGDWDTAREVRQEFDNDVNKMVEEVDGDWSKIDLSQIQSAAMRYAQDDRTRQLIAYKQNADAYSKMMHDIESSSKGKALSFGIDPTTNPLYDNSGKATNSQAWKLEDHLDYNKQAQDLFKDIGHKLADKVGINPEDKDWYIQWTNWWEQHKDNHAQIDEVIGKAYQNYIDQPAGSQYYRKLEDDYRKLHPNATTQEVDAYAKPIIQNLIAWAGESKKNTEDQKKMHLQTLNKPEPPQPRSYGTSNGNGTESDPVPERELHSTDEVTFSYNGITYLGKTDPLSAANSLTDPNYVMTDRPEDPTQILNTNAFVSHLLEVGDVDQSRLSGSDLRYNGGLFNLDETGTSGSSPYKRNKNRSTFKVIYAQYNDLATQLNALKADENASINIQDYAAGYREYNGGKYNESAMRDKFGKELNSPWASMFTITNKGNGEIDIIVDPVLEKTLDILRSKLNDETLAQEARELAEIKYERLANKLSQAYAFIGDRDKRIPDLDGNTIQSYDENYDWSGRLLQFKNHHKRLIDTKRGYERAHEIFAQEAGLNQEQIKSLENDCIKRGLPPDFWKGEASAKFFKAKVGAYDAIYQGSKAGLGYGATGSPSTVYQQLQPYWKPENVGTQDAFALYMNLADDLMNGNLNPSEMAKEMGKDVAKDYGVSTLGYDYTGTLIEDYFNHLVNEKKLYKDDNEKESTLGIINSGVSGLDKIVKGYGVESGVVNKFVLEKSPIEYQQLHNENRIKLMKSVGSTEVVEYFRLIDESKETYGREQMIYLVPKGNTDPPGKATGLEERLKTTVWNALTDKSQSGKRITKIRHNEWHTTSPEKEDFDVELFNLAKNAMLGTGKSIDEAKNENIMIKGITVDSDNDEDPFSIVVDVATGAGATRRMETVEIPYKPTLSELTVMGVPYMTYHYAKEIQIGLNESGNYMFELGRDEQGKTMRFYRAAVNMDNGNIKTGDYYIIGADGKPSASINQSQGKLIGFKSEEQAIQYYLNWKKQDENFDTKEQLAEIYNEFMSANGNINKLQGISQKWFGVPNMTADRVFEELQKINADDVGTKMRSISTKDGNSTLDQKLSSMPLIKQEVANNMEFNNSYPNGYKLSVGSLSDDAVYNVAKSMNPLIPSEYDIKANGELYPKYQKGSNEPIDVSTIDLSNYNNWSVPKGKKVLNEYSPDMIGFIGEINKMANDKEFKLTEPINIVSGRRSLRENLDAYDQDLKSFTDSDHMYGNAIDVRTEDHSTTKNKDTSHIGGNELMTFLKTPKGLEILSKYGLRAYYHKVDGDTWHIDIAKGKASDAGKFIDDRFNKTYRYQQ